jgi:hypothetical protein
VPSIPERINITIKTSTKMDAPERIKNNLFFDLKKYRKKSGMPILRKYAFSREEMLYKRKIKRMINL